MININFLITTIKSTSNFYNFYSSKQGDIFEFIY